MSQRTTSDGTVAHFDRIAPAYADLYTVRSPVGHSFRVRRQRVLDLFDAPGGKILDIGCGPGVMVESLVERGCEFWGVDPSHQMIAAGRTAFRSFPGVHFIEGGAERLDFPDEEFDAVLCMGVLERIADDKSALREMARVLKPGGSLIISVPNSASPILRWRDHVFYPAVGLLRSTKARLTRRPAPPVVRGYRLYGRRAFTSALAEAGCASTGVEYCAYSIFFAPLDSLFPKTAAAFMGHSERLRRSPLRGLGAAFVVRATKQYPA